MEESKLEQLEKLFPNGFLLVYPVKDEKSVRMHWWVPKDTDACHEIYAIQKLIHSKATEIKDGEEG